MPVDAQHTGRIGHLINVGDPSRATPLLGRPSLVEVTTDVPIDVTTDVTVKLTTKVTTKATTRMTIDVTIEGSNGFRSEIVLE